MNNLATGFVLTIVGMGGTLLSLWLLIVVVQLLKRVLPYREEDEKSGKEVA